MSESTVSKSWVDLVIATAANAGVDIQELLPCLGENIDNQQRFDLDDVVLLWDKAIELSRDENFGLHAGASLTPGRLNVVSHIVMSSRSLAEGLGNAIRYRRLISDGGDISLELKQDRACIRYQPKPQKRPFNRHQIEAVIASMVTLIRWGFNSQFTPEAVHFSHPAPDSTEEHQTLFGCDVLFEQEFDGLILPGDLLHQVINPDDSLAQIHEQMAQKMLAALDQSSWTTKVRQLLEGRLSEGDIHRDWVAKQLNVSAKTLQRRLAEEDTRFQQILDQLRKDTAIEYLQQDELTLDEIAELLGFTESSAFFRAFKRWTDTTPSEYLKQI